MNIRWLPVGSEGSGAPAGHLPSGKSDLNESTETGTAAAPGEQCED